MGLVANHDESLEEQKDDTEKKPAVKDELDGDGEEEELEEKEPDDEKEEEEGMKDGVRATKRDPPDTEWGKALFKLVVAKPDYFNSRYKTAAREEIVSSLQKQNFRKKSGQVKAALNRWIYKKRAPLWMSDEDKAKLEEMRTAAVGTDRRVGEWGQALFKLLVTTPEFRNNWNRVAVQKKIAASLRKKGFNKTYGQVEKMLFGWIWNKSVPKWMNDEDKKNLEAMRQKAAESAKTLPWLYYLFKEAVAIGYFSLEKADKKGAREQIVASLEKHRIESDADRIKTSLQHIFRQTQVPYWLTEEEDKEEFKKIKEIKEKDPVLCRKPKVVPWLLSLFKQLVAINYFDVDDKVAARKKIIAGLEEEKFEREDVQVLKGINNLFVRPPKWLTDPADLENYRKLKERREEFFRLSGKAKACLTRRKRKAQASSRGQRDGEERRGDQEAAQDRDEDVAKGKGKIQAKGRTRTSRKRRRIEVPSEDERDEEEGHGDQMASDVADLDEGVADDPPDYKGAKDQMEDTLTPLQKLKGEDEELEGGAMDQDEAMDDGGPLGASENLQMQYNEDDNGEDLQGDVAHLQMQYNDDYFYGGAMDQDYSMMSFGESGDAVEAREDLTLDADYMPSMDFAPLEPAQYQGNVSSGDPTHTVRQELHVLQSMKFEPADDDKRQVLLFEGSMGVPDEEKLAMEQRLTEMRENADRLQETNDCLQTTNDRLQETNDSLQTTNDSLYETNDRLQETNNKIQKLLEREEEQKKAQEEVLAAMQKKIEELEMAKTSDEPVASVRELGALTMDETTEMNRRLLKELDELEKREAEGKEERRRKDARIQRKNEAILRKDAEILKLRMELMDRLDSDEDNEEGEEMESEESKEEEETNDSPLLEQDDEEENSEGDDSEEDEEEGDSYSNDTVNIICGSDDDDDEEESEPATDPLADVARLAELEKIYGRIRPQAFDWQKRTAPTDEQMKEAREWLKSLHRDSSDDDDERQKAKNKPKATEGAELLAIKEENKEVKEETEPRQKELEEAAIEEDEPELPYTEIDEEDVKNLQLKELLKLRGHVIGTRNKKFQIHEPVGCGAFGLVFRSMHIRTGKIRALKLVIDEEAKEFEQEMMEKAQSWKPLNRFICLPTLSFDGRWNGASYRAFSMDLLPLELDSLINPENEEHGEKTFSTPSVVSALAQMMSAVAFINSKGFIFSDLKPDNVMVRRFSVEENDGKEIITDITICLIDLNVAMEIGSGVVLCQPASYRAPEVIFGYDINVRIDSFSAGLIALEMLNKDYIAYEDYKKDDKKSLYEHIGLLEAVLGEEMPTEFLQKCGLRREDVPKNNEAPSMASILDPRVGELSYHSLLLDNLIPRLLDINPDDRMPPDQVATILHPFLPL